MLEDVRAGRPALRKLARRLAAAIVEWRRRRARPSLGSWMAMDPRVLADIGVARADLQAVVFGGVPFAQLGGKAADPDPDGLPLPTRRPLPRLRLLGVGHMDAVA